MSDSKRWRHTRGEPWIDKTVGRRGVVYVLSNDAFRENFLKIGSTTREVEYRIDELNNQVVTAIPGCFKCLYRLEVVDCGSAEFLAHEKLSAFRKGKHGTDHRGKTWGQEFFEVPLERAVRAVEEACQQIEAEHAERQLREEEERRRQESEAAEERTRHASLEAPIEDIRSSYVYSWDRKREGPSGVTVGCVLAGLVVAVMYVSGSQKTPPAKPAPQQRVSGVGQSRETFRSLDAGNRAQQVVSGDVPGGSVFVTQNNAGGASMAQLQFPAGGSALYFSGRAEGQNVATSLRLYAPPLSKSRYAVLVISATSNQVYAQAYLEPNDVVDVPLPAGRFRIAYSAGFEWFGTQLMFGPRKEVKVYGGELDAGRSGQLFRVELPVE